jgi:hypothetical protein
MAQDFIRFRFELGYGVFSDLIARFGFSYGGWSHVRPLLDDGSSIDSYEDDIYAPNGGWKGFPPVIPSGVQHRPENFRRVKRSCIVEVPVTLKQKQAWLRFLWEGADAGLAYDHAAIEGYILGGNRHARKADICSAWARQSGKHIGLGHRSNVPSHEVSPDMFYAIVQEGWGGQVIPSSRKEN